MENWLRSLRPIEEGDEETEPLASRVPGDDLDADVSEERGSGRTVRGSRGECFSCLRERVERQLMLTGSV